VEILCLYVTHARVGERIGLQTKQPAPAGTQDYEQTFHFQ